MLATIAWTFLAVVHLSTADPYEDFIYYNETTAPLIFGDPGLLQRSVDAIENELCRNHSQLVLNNVQNFTDWAVKFYDASGKFSEGLLAGSVYQLGNFDQCLGIGLEDRETPDGIRGQYCHSVLRIGLTESHGDKRNSAWRYFLEPKDRMDMRLNKLHWGICVPASCTPRDIEHGLKKILDEVFLDSPVTLTPILEERSCYRDEPVSVNTIDIFYACTILLVICVIICGTIFHAVCLRREEKTPTSSTGAQVLIAFSAISNVRKLLKPARNEGIDCVSGIKVFSMILIIAGHTVMYVISGPMYNAKFFNENIAKVGNAALANNPLLVDSFLLLSGFLFSSLFIRELNERKSVNIPLLYVARFIRLTPTYVVIIGFYTTWMSKLDSGPMWYMMRVEKERCLASWWANLLYINNYVNTDKLCMFQSWYLSVDMHLFLLAPAIIYPIWRWRSFGVTLLCGLIALSIVVNFVEVYWRDLYPTLMIYMSEMVDLSDNEYFRSTYIKTHLRATSYLIGLLCGYIVSEIQAKKYRLSKTFVRLGWLLGSLSIILSICSVTVFYGPRRHYTTLEAAFYSPLHRAFWAAGTAWVIVACVTDHAGPVKKILSWSALLPLSRLTYCAYLVNGLVVLYHASTVRTPIYASYYNTCGLIIYHIVYSFTGAFLLSLTFESPILALEYIFLRKGRRKPAKGKECQEDGTPQNP